MWEDFGEPAGDEYYASREEERRKRQEWIANKIRSVLDGGAQAITICAVTSSPPSTFRMRISTLSSGNRRAL